MKPEQLKTIDLTVSRTIRGTAEEVYDAWLDQKTPGGLWFGVDRVILNLAVDGLFYHAVKHEGRSWPHYGRFIHLDRGRAIEHTWVSEATRGLESVVTITLAPRDGGTEVTLRHANLPDDEMGRTHQDGWTWYLGVLGERFEKVAAR
ncbi:MAG TPA: SRPBCC domain-containing protein [Vicinamibacterales bacterium]|nr:SRPBCC domain-containing protein [Vicinamibacterales bacterium]